MDNGSFKFIYDQDYNRSRLLWDLNNTNKELVEIQLFAERIEDLNNGLLDKINKNSYKCYICDVNVPIMFSQQHISSLKHKVYKSIIDNCLDRLKQHLDTGTIINDITKPSNVLFCDNCSTVVKESDYHCHKLTEKHITNAVMDETIVALEKVLTQSVICSNKCNNNTTFYVENKTVKNILNTGAIVDQTDNEIKDDSQMMKEEAYNAFYKQCDAFKNDFSESYDTKKLSHKDIDKDSKEEINANNNCREIQLDDGSLVEVSADNFNGFQVHNDIVQCIICDEIVENKKKHIFTVKHWIPTHVLIDGNCIRQVDEKWWHCIVCNTNISNFDIHITSETHIANVKDRKIYGRKKRKRQRGKQCGPCDVTIKGPFINHAQTEKHLDNENLLDVTEINKVLFDNYSPTENESGLKCKYCGESISNDVHEAVDHINSQKHVLVCNELLLKNKIKKTNTGKYFCDLCSLEILKGFEFIHINNQLHKDRVINDESAVSAPSNLDEKKLDSERHPFILSPIDHLRMQCIICKVDVPNSETNLTQHVSSKYHQTEYKEMLRLNKIQKINKTIFCHVCKKYFSSKKAWNHINSDLHTEALRVGLESESKDSSNNPSITDEPIIQVQNQAINSLTPHTSTTEFMYQYKRSSNTYQMDCLVCNVKVRYSESNLVEHALSSNHKTNYHEILQSNKLTKMIKGKMFKCQFCQIFVLSKKELDHINTGLHKNAMNSILKSDSAVFSVSDTKETITNKPIIQNTNTNLMHHYKVSSMSSIVDCLVCNVKVPNTESNKIDHALARKHKTKYENLLNINQLKVKENAFSCHVCKLDIAKKKELDHINSERHKNAMHSSSNYQTIVNEPSCQVDMNQSPENQENAENFNTYTDATLNNESEMNLILGYIFEETGNPKQVNCKVCRKRVGKHISCMQEHVDGKQHLDNYTNILKDNAIMTVNTAIFCGACNEPIEKFGELIHLEKPEHIQKLTEFKINEAKVAKYHCKVCNIDIPNNTINDHNETESHRNHQKITETSLNQDILINTKESPADNEQASKIDADINELETIEIHAKTVSEQSQSNSNENDQSYEMQGQVKQSPDGQESSQDSKTSFISVEFYCKLCDVKIPNIFGSKNSHSESIEHKINSQMLIFLDGDSNYIESDAEENKDSEAIDLDLACMFEETDIITQVVCKVCRKQVDKLNSTMQIHSYGKKHWKKYEKMLENNLITIVNAEYFCNACNEAVETFGEFDHFEKPEHIINLSKACNDDVDKNDISDHEESNKNQLKVQETSVLPDLADSIEIPDSVIDSMFQMNFHDNSGITCVVCQKPMAQSNISDHLKNQVHRSLVRETISFNKLIFKVTNFYCSVCNVTIINDYAINHISSSPHKKNFFLHDSTEC